MAFKGVVKPRYRSVPVDRQLARRVERVVAAMGEQAAAKRLGVGKPTLDECRGYGALRPCTVERLVAGVEQWEREQLAEVGT